MIDLADYRGKRVLITGAGGFIGSHLTEACARLGATVTAMTRYNSSSSRAMLKHADRQIMDEVSVIAGNIEDSEFVHSAMEGQDVVFHLAALIAIPYSYVAPRSYIRTNVEGTLNILEAARRAGTRVVHTSTSEVYGTALRVPIDEDHPLQGQSPYSASKIAADKLVESYVLSFGLDAVTARPFNTFGPRQSARAFIPTVFFQALTSECVELGALDPLRDMTYVADTVEGFLRAGIAENVAGETINFGTGESHSIGTIARRILELMGRDIPIQSKAERLRPSGSEVLRLVSDNSKARKVIDWGPRTSLDEGLLRTIDHIRQNAAEFHLGYAI